MPVTKHFGVNIDPHKGRIMAQIMTPQVDLGQLGAHRDDQIGLRNHRCTGSARQIGPKVQRRIWRNNTAPCIGRHAGRVPAGQCIVCPINPASPATKDKQGPPRIPQSGHQCVHVAVLGGSMRHARWQSRRVRRRPRLKQRNRHRQIFGSWSRALELQQGAINQVHSPGPVIT